MGFIAGNVSRSLCRLNTFLKLKDCQKMSTFDWIVLVVLIGVFIWVILVRIKE